MTVCPVSRTGKRLLQTKERLLLFFWFLSSDPTVEIIKLCLKIVFAFVNYFLLFICVFRSTLAGPNVLGIGVSTNEDLTMMEHPPLLSPPIPLPPPGMELGLGGPPPGMSFDSLFPPPHFIPPAPFMPPDAGMMPPMHLMPSIPPPPSGMLADHHRPPPLGMIATGSFDVDYRRELSDPPPPRRYPSPPRRYPSPLGSERSIRSDRSDRMDRYDDHFRYFELRQRLSIVHRDFIDSYFCFGYFKTRLSLR